MAGRAGAISLEGMTIVVLGAAGTLAECFAVTAARAGARLVLADRVQPAPGSLPEGSVAETAVIDITDSAGTVAFFEKVQARWGKLDVVVNFAGIHHPPFDLVNDDPPAVAERFRQVVDVNLNGTFIVTTAAARVMVPGGGGHIIHLCSNGSRMALYGSYGYNASKHGVEGVVKTAAAQLAPAGVRVNAIAPGTVVTGLNQTMLYDEAGELLPRARSILAHTPTKRFATPEGIAETLLSMCVPQRHLTGNIVFADDGYNIEGHSWPEGNMALYGSTAELEELLERARSRSGDGAISTTVPTPPERPEY